MKERARAGLTAFALTVGVLGALSAPAAAVEPSDGTIVLDVRIDDPTKYFRPPVACGDNMHWGNPECPEGRHNMHWGNE
ncbi:hypothetical protein [Herbidospora sp. RD11066]